MPQRLTKQDAGHFDATANRWLTTLQPDAIDFETLGTDIDVEISIDGIFCEWLKDIAGAVAPIVFPMDHYRREFAWDLVCYLHSFKKPRYVFTNDLMNVIWLNKDSDYREATGFTPEESYRRFLLVMGVDAQDIIRHDFSIDDLKLD